MRTSHLLVSTFFAAILTNCQEANCPQQDHKNVLLLVDVSDKQLFQEIGSDLDANFLSFLDAVTDGKKHVGSCERLSMSMIQAGGNHDLKIVSESVGFGNVTGRSYKEVRQKGSLKPFVDMVATQLKQFEVLADDGQANAQSNLLNVLLKVLNEGDDESDKLVVFFTDGVENSMHLNMYKSIPSASATAADILEQIVDPNVLSRYKNRQRDGNRVKVLMVLKNEPNNKVDKRKVIHFWTGIYEELDADFQIIDHLSNRYEL